jgi:hypothetical protein
LDALERHLDRQVKRHGRNTLSTRSSGQRPRRTRR